MRRLRLDRLEDRTVPTTVIWDGGPDGGGVSADNHWTTATNWVGDVAPHAGDDLVFPTGAKQLTATNDFAAGTAFNSLALNVGYTLAGNGIARCLDDYPVAKYLRDARVMTLYEGTSQVQKLLIGRALIGINAFI